VLPQSFIPGTGVHIETYVNVAGQGEALVGAEETIEADASLCGTEGMIFHSETLLEFHQLVLEHASFHL
jgi:hypothetical protein